MMRTLCKSKIHGATVTEANLQYVGSLTLDPALMRAADLLPYEQVQVVNVNNGARFETYCIEGPPGSGTVCMNGAAARCAAAGDHILIISYAQVTRDELKSFEPKLVFVDEHNQIRPSGHRVVEVPTKRNGGPGKLSGRGALGRRVSSRRAARRRDVPTAR